METIWQDLRYGARMLLKQPGFTLVAILTLAVGIGANSAIFSVVNAVLLRPLPLSEPDRLIKIYESYLPAFRQGSVSPPNLKDWREQNDVFEGIAAYNNFGSYSLQGNEHPERVQGARVSANFFDIAGVQPRLGRAFEAAEEQQGRHRVVILSDALWRRNFAADPDIVGREILLGGETYSVVGVMPPEFRFPSRLTELWTPLALSEQQLASRGNHWLQALARLKPAVTVEQAREQMSAIARRIEEQYPAQQANRNVTLNVLQEETVQNVRPALLVLLVAVGFVLLIACVNVANLLLARAAARRREIAIRAAVGAGRGRLVRQFLTESVLLALLGGALGLMLAKWGVDALSALATGILPRAHEVALDWQAVAATLLLAVLTGIGFGLVPALQISRADVQEALREGARAGAGPRRNWFRSLLVVIEVAAALVLLVGAGLLIRSFMRLQEIDTGLQAERVLTLRLSLPAARYKDAAAVVNFHKLVLERVTGLPGVQAVGVINLLPLQDWGWNGPSQIEGREPFPAGQAPVIENRAVSPDYFRAMGIPLIAGRSYDERDAANSEPVVLINQTLARQYWGDESPVGRRISTGHDESKWIRIVGVVGDVKQSGLTRETRPEFYLPYTQAGYSLTNNMSLAVRATGDPTTLTAAIRNAVQAVDLAQPIYQVQTMEEVIATSINDRRFNMLLLGIFAGVAMLLAIVGIYSVMSYSVTQGTREIGIRMALGAQPTDVLKLVVGQGAALALIGVGVGLAGAFGLTRLMASLLYGVSAADPLTFGAIAVLLVGVALLACYLPARRATKVDPLVALRHE